MSRNQTATPKAAIGGEGQEERKLMPEKPVSQIARTILVVEDSTTQALYLRTLLEQKGLNVRWARDGAEGVELARQQGPDLIILDIQMPEMNGFEVCQRLKETTQTADIPVIMFTRYDDAQSVLSSLEKGAIDYIPKDAFAEAVLLETLREMGFLNA
ncbi:MAG: PleD family two-component system response regulator [Anaerolineae bacterium]|jgi:CheY-like chemotaxis protein